MENKKEINHWVWSTLPQYHEGLETAKYYWWSCHKDTKEGDLILLYRSHSNKDLGFLAVAESDAEEVGGEWVYECECRFIYRFKNSLTLAEMKVDPYLSEHFAALRGNFQHRAYYISPNVWKYLSKKLSRKNPAYINFLAELEKS